MGQTIGWRRYNSTTGERGESVSDLPEWFDGKWTGRFEWYISIFSVPFEEVDKDDWCGDSFARPKDFKAFRAALDAIKDESVTSQHWPDLKMSDVRQSWKECTDWLEAHPDVFVNYG